AMGDIGERGQLLGQTVPDCGPALEGAVGHQLHGVVGVQVHHAVQITSVVQLDVTVQQASVTIHCPSPRLLPPQVAGHDSNVLPPASAAAALTRGALRESPPDPCSPGGPDIWVGLQDFRPTPPVWTCADGGEQRAAEGAAAGPARDEEPPASLSAAMTDDGTA